MPRMVLLEAVSNINDISGVHPTVMFEGVGPSVYSTETFQRRVANWCIDNNFDPESDVFILTGRLTKIALALATIRGLYYNRPLHIAIWNGALTQYDEKVLLPLHELQANHAPV